MPDDRSLDEFATADADAADGDDAPETGDAPDTDDADGGDDAEPVTATYDHSPAGADCAACGTTTTRRWRDDPGYVCADCKEW